MPRVHLSRWLVQYAILDKADMSIYLAIAVGGSLGAVSRYWMVSSTHQWLGNGFPYGTLAVNLLGSLVMGFLWALLLYRFEVSEELRHGLLVGFLGSFTTFSAFALDVLHLGGGGEIWKAALYITLSVLLCVLGAWTGLLAARQFI